MTVNTNSNDDRQKVVNFADTLLFVESHNEKFEKGELFYKLKVNSRAILSSEEKNAFMNGLNPQIEAKLATQISQPSFPPAPESLDYRQLGYVTEVYDQGDKSLQKL